MSTITITESDRREAELYLESFLTQSVPGGDFSKGSYLRDLAITSMAYTVAHLRGEAANAMSRSSVNRVKAMLPSADRDDAADDLMSNWFLSRKAGRPSRGTILINLSAKVDLVIPNTTRFYYAPSLAFVPDYDSTVVIPTDSIIEVPGVDTPVAARYALLSVVASSPGSEYDVQPATWTTYDRFSPYVTQITSSTPFVGGKSTESTDEFLSRASDAVSTKDLVTDRSIRATLKDRFTCVDDVVVVGAGDPEMYRDLVAAGGVLRIHSGGFYDSYIRGPVGPAPLVEAISGTAFTDHRRSVTLLAADSLYGKTISPGMVLRIHNPATPAEATMYTITQVYGNVISVTDRCPFPRERSGVTFSIGTDYPTFSNVLSSGTGSFTRQLTIPRSVIMPAHPVYAISEVLFQTGSLWEPLRRINPPLGGAHTYWVDYLDSAQANSGYQMMVLTTSFDVPDNSNLRITYDTIPGFASVHNYVVDPHYRVACADTLAKAMFPVYAALTVNIYQLPSVSPPAEADVQQAVVDYLDALPSGSAFRLPVLAASLLRTFAGQVAGITIPWDKARFDLYDPTGNIVPYMVGQDDAQLIIAPEFETTAPPWGPYLPDPLAYGISSRTIVLLSSPDYVTVAYV